MRICDRCGTVKTGYVKRKVKMDSGIIMVLCKPCSKVWDKLFRKKFPKGVGEPEWSQLWNTFIRGYEKKEEPWSVS